jgi:hypothetical protein
MLTMDSRLTTLRRLRHLECSSKLVPGEGKTRLPRKPWFSHHQAEPEEALAQVAHEGVSTAEYLGAKVGLEPAHAADASLQVLVVALDPLLPAVCASQRTGSTRYALIGMMQPCAGS